MKVFEILKVGEPNALSQEKLRVALGYANTRAVRREINLERRDGHLIMSSAAGYYLPADKAEVRRYVQRCERRLRKSFLTLRAARDYLNQIDGQESMELINEPDEEDPI